MKPLLKFNSNKKTEDDFFSDREDDEEQQGASDAQNESNSDNDVKNDNEDAMEKKPVKIKNVVRKPQPKLDSNRLCGPRGLECLLDTFKDIKLKGAGHEFRDLDIMISKYEYWAHRLFPKMKFIDVVERLEKLGEKRDVKNLMNKLRLGNNVENVEDPALENERMTERVMSMMNDLQSDNDNNDNNDDNDEIQKNTTNETDMIANFNQSKKAKRIDDNDDDEDEDELFNRLLSTY